MNRLNFEIKIAERCKSASEFVAALCVGLILSVPFLIEISKELK